MKALLFRAIQQLAFIAFSACAPAIVSDPGPFPFEANDPTALLIGCGQRAAVGHLMCRFPAGVRPSGEIVVVVPPVECGYDSCAQVTIWEPSAAKLVDRAIPAGQTYVVIPWASLVGSEKFREDQRGFYPVLVRWRWLDSSGELMGAAAEGEIRLRVHRGDYTPLSYDPSAGTWQWKVGGVTFIATDKGRSAVKP